MDKKSKTPEAQLKAIAKYDAKRTDKPVTTRYYPEEMAKIDKARGDESRASFQRRAVMELLEREGS